MSSSTFGRDEMNALIGGSANGDGAEEMAAFRQSQPTSRQPASSKGAIKEVDISKMTAAETARMLSEKARNSASNNSSRYRSQNKVLAHHQLLAEELSKQQTQEEQKLTNEASSKKTYDTDDQDDDEDAEFVRERRPVQAAVVVSRRPTENRSRRRRSDSSSSSSSSEESQKRSRRSRRDRRRDRDNSSSSSSDEEDDRRRNKRVLASRRMKQEPETLVPKLKGEAETQKPVETKRNDSIDDEEETIQAKPRVERMISQPSKLAQRPGRSDSSSDDAKESDSSSSSSSDSSSSESSSEDDEPVRLKPVFVPKHKRNLVQSEERRLEEEDLKLQLDKERKLKRKAESRALLAKELAAAESSLQNDDDDGQDDEYGGATNAPPNDDDEVDKERERNEWEIREIERLLKSIDELELRKKEEEEYTRRKKLTDAECLKEDMESGRYQAPGANRDKRANQSGASQNQRFFHRGAFYMDESEWKEGDIREKAADYAATATGEDLIDRSKLPEVMQVKNFGHARQNTRYKGLAKEDTTDKFAPVLPLRKNQRPNR